MTTPSQDLIPENPDHYEWRNERGPRGNVREAVAVFDNERDMQEAVEDLETHGFTNAAVSRPAAPERIVEAIHHPIRSVQEIEDDASVPREAFVDPDSRNGGLALMVLVPAYVLLLGGIAYGAANGMSTLQLIMVAMALGAVGAGIGAHYALRARARGTRRLQAERALGGLVLWVRTGSQLQEDRALSILRQHHAHDVHMHGPAFA